jgi:hypothetical protein
MKNIEFIAQAPEWVRGLRKKSINQTPFLLDLSESDLGDIASNFFFHSYKTILVGYTILAVGNIL